MYFSLEDRFDEDLDVRPIDGFAMAQATIYLSCRLNLGLGNGKQQYYQSESRPCQPRSHPSTHLLHCDSLLTRVLLHTLLDPGCTLLGVLLDLVPVLALKLGILQLINHTVVLRDVL